jgi:hypothetical protein
MITNENGLFANDPIERLDVEFTTLADLLALSFLLGIGFAVLF